MKKNAKFGLTVSILTCNGVSGEVACQLSEDRAPLRELIQDYIKSEVSTFRQDSQYQVYYYLRQYAGSCGMDDNNASMYLLEVYTIAGF